MENRNIRQVPMISPRQAKIESDGSSRQGSSSSTLHSEMAITPSQMLWVKDEPFTFGIISPHVCTKIGVNRLRKVAEYCREKKGYYPNIRFEQWGHISKYKLILPIELSWAYLRAFHLLKRGAEVPHENLKPKDAWDWWDARLEDIRLRSVDLLEVLKVDTLQFLIFLYIQNFYGLNKKKSSTSASGRPFDDHWPSDQSGGSSTSLPAGSSALIKQPAKTVKRKNIPEQLHLEFIERNIEDIVDYLTLAIAKPPEPLVEPKGKRSKDGVTSTADQSYSNRIPLVILEALSFLIGSATVSAKPKDTEFSSLADFAKKVSEVGKALDLNRKTATVDRKKFIDWVLANLKLNPWSQSSAPVTQHVVPCLSGIWRDMKSFESNKIFWNTQPHPKGWYLISTIVSQVLYLDCVKPLSSLKIHRCSDSYIYVPTVFNSVLVEKCHNCTIFLGPATKFVKFVECTNLQVTALGRHFILQDVYKGTFNILTPTPPIICGSKGKKLVFGPYNSSYPKVELDMLISGLQDKVQKWSRPLELDTQGLPVPKPASSQTPTGSPAASSQSSFSVQRPELFRELLFPFEMEGPTSRNPVDIPRSYERKIIPPETILTAFKAEVEKMNFTDEKNKMFEAIVQTRFRNWLKEEGHMDQLLGLKSIQDTVRSGSKVPVFEELKTNTNIMSLSPSLTESGEVPVV